MHFHKGFPFFVAYYKLNNSYADETANGYNLTGTNSPTFSTDVPNFPAHPGLATTTYTYSYAGTSTSPNRQYIGQFYDDVPQLSYLNARYYEGSRGQFLSEDPTFWGDPKAQLLTDPQSLNSYSYAANNPITKSDPSGKFWWKEFYTNWSGYDVTRMDWDNGLILKAGEVFGGRFAAQDAIAANTGNIAASASQTGISPAVYQAIMYEENAHQFPPFGGERTIENVLPQLVSGGIGVMQVSSGASGLSNTKLLDDRTNVNAAGLILQGIQSQYGNNPATLGSYYNNRDYGPSLQHSQYYGSRVNTYSSTNLSPTIGDRVVRSGAGIATGGISSILGAISSALSSIGKILNSLK